MADLRATLDKADYKYIVEKPDPSFSVERNKAVIQETIKDTEKFFREMYAPLHAGMGERIDIIATYGRYRFNKGHKNIKQYLGDELYKQLVGEKILSKVRIMESVNKLNGNDKFNKFIVK